MTKVILAVVAFLAGVALVQAQPSKDLHFRWTDNSTEENPATVFRIYENVAGTWVQVAVVPKAPGAQQHFVMSVVQAAHRFAVRAGNEFGESPNSAEARTPAGPPGRVNVRTAGG